MAATATTPSISAEATGIDTVIDSSGNDTILSTVTRSINGWAFIEGLILQGGAAINGTGNALNNGIVGNGAANVLAGLGGNDTILGGGGNDTIYGQVGFDDMNGQAGDDTFVYQSAGDALSSFMGFPAGDVIRGFDASGNDRINLQAVYGPALAYKGVAAFNGIGQVRIQVSGPDLFVQVNLDANVTTAEMALLLQATAIGLIGIDDFML